MIDNKVFCKREHPLNNVNVQFLTPWSVGGVLDNINFYLKCTKIKFVHDYMYMYMTDLLYMCILIKYFSLSVLYVKDN